MTDWIEAPDLSPFRWTIYIPSNDYNGIIETIKFKKVDDAPGRLPEGACRYMIQVLSQGRWYKLSTTIIDLDQKLSALDIRDLLVLVTEGEIAKELV